MLHRLPEQHDCLFDHLGRGRQEAVLKMVKLDRKVGRSCQRIGEECSWAPSPPQRKPPCSAGVSALPGIWFSSFYSLSLSNQLTFFFFDGEMRPSSFPLWIMFIVLFKFCRNQHLVYSLIPLAWSYPCSSDAFFFFFWKKKNKSNTDRTIKSKGNMISLSCKLLTTQVWLE